MNETIFHIYKKNSEKTEIIKHSIPIDEFEQMIANREINWKDWDIVPCFSEYQVEDGSF
jgi:hypothetical protein|tara:strand:- start:758 stop:934 length:177 start_codon:yes stop_codon:yes gene_type:complete